MRKPAKIFSVAVLMGLFTALAAATSAHAGLKARSAATNPNTGNIPFWFQDANGVSVQPCLDADPAGVNEAPCGLLPEALGDGGNATFDPTQAAAFPNNIPSAFTFFTASVDPATFTVSGAATRIDMNLGVLFFAPNGNEGPLGDPLATGVVFQEVFIRINPAPFAGVYTLRHPWGQLTFSCPTAGDDCRPAIESQPAEAVIDFNAARDGNLISSFLQSATAPAGFLGDGITPGPVTGGTARNSIIVVDPQGGVSTAANLIITGKKLGMKLDPGAINDLGGVNINAGVPTKKTIKVTNDVAALGGVSVVLTSVKAGDDALDFTVGAPTQPAAPAPALTDCAGATLTPGQSCAFDVTFTPAVAAKAGRVATITLDTTPADPDNVPPVDVNLSGTALVSLTTSAATPNGTISLNNPPALANTAPAGSAVTFTVTPANSKFKVRDVLDGTTPVAGPLFTLNTGIVSHAVTASFMPSGNLTGSGTLGVPDAVKALRIAVGLDTPTDEDKLAMDVAPLGGDGRPAGDQGQDLRDVLLILRRVLGLVTW